MPGFVLFLAGCIAVNASYTAVFFLYFYSQFFRLCNSHSVTKLNLFTTYGCIHKGNKSGGGSQDGYPDWGAAREIFPTDEHLAGINIWRGHLEAV